MLRKLLPLWSSLSLMAAAQLAHAHSVWIEPLDSKLVIRFAEPDGKLEKSPGYLDSLSVPLAFVLVTNAPIAVEAPKKADHFLMVGSSPTNVACAETTFTVRAGRKPYFYARWQPVGAAASTPLQTLDLVPNGQSGEVRAYFRGKPLAGIKAKLRSPDEKEVDLVADAEGLLRFSASQSGQYLLTVAHHREPLPGHYLGVAYKETSHNAALSWWQP